jgi:hypothetical protein
MTTLPASLRRTAVRHTAVRCSSGKARNKAGSQARSNAAGVAAAHSCEVYRYTAVRCSSGKARSQVSSL